MLIPFELDLAKMAVMAETGIIETKNGDSVEILNWNDNGSIYGVVHSWTHKTLFLHWDFDGKLTCIISEWRNYDLVIKPIIPL